MRRTLPLVVALAVFAVACTSGAARTDEDLVEGVVEADTPQDAAAQAEAARRSQSNDIVGQEPEAVAAPAEPRGTFSRARTQTQ